MNVIYERSAGLNVQNKQVIACRRRMNESSEWVSEVESFHIKNVELRRLLDWLLAWDVEVVVVQSIDRYWKQLCDLFEGNFETWVVNNQSKTLSCRKTAVNEAECLAQMLSYGF